MANPSISIPDDLLEDFDRIVDVKEMLGELESDNRSPVIQDLMREYVEENEEYLERYEQFVEGNGKAVTAATAD
ncbi:CopG family ribbon-helix-helix protein [Natronorubrum halophilum]|uniref:CopG family ribbon-helix-helix protein n=1 Tax=Natronorubrum halophilum TaxID=1702106 RepID=UPI0010C16109|nr:ribbon-helix-helix domain-containing protein [Natronorubrum halophilum]